MTERKKVSLPFLFNKVANEEPITMLTRYDYPIAHFQEQAGVDIILVGDSLGMTMLGYESTLPVTMDDMVRHSKAVRIGTPKAWLIGDMLYTSYQPSVEIAGHVGNISAKHEGSDPDLDSTRPHPSDILDYFREKDEIIESGDWEDVTQNFLDKIEAPTILPRLSPSMGSLSSRQQTCICEMRPI
jgi:hypothetical protein